MAVVATCAQARALQVCDVRYSLLIITQHITQTILQTHHSYTYHTSYAFQALYTLVYLRIYRYARAASFQAYKDCAKSKEVQGSNQPS